jgi:hypothetical protein
MIYKYRLQAQKSPFEQKVKEITRRGQETSLLGQIRALSPLSESQRSQATAKMSMPAHPVAFGFKSVNAVHKLAPRHTRTALSNAGAREANSYEFFSVA